MSTIEECRLCLQEEHSSGIIIYNGHRKEPAAKEMRMTFSIQKFLFRIRIPLCIFFLFLFVFLCACTAGPSEHNEDPVCPFSSAVWSQKEEEIKANEGEPESILLSVYGGNLLTYSKNYLGRSGTLKYMFSEDGDLASIAWAFITSEPDDLITLYEEIDRYELEKNGESQFSSENSTSYGDVWYLNDCDILISTIFGNDSCGLQYAYINHAFSKR